MQCDIETMQTLLLLSFHLLLAHILRFIHTNTSCKYILYCHVQHYWKIEWNSGSFEHLIDKHSTLISVLTIAIIRIYIEPNLMWAIYVIVHKTSIRNNWIKKNSRINCANLSRFDFAFDTLSASSEFSINFRRIQFYSGKLYLLDSISWLQLKRLTSSACNRNVVYENERKCANVEN